MKRRRKLCVLLLCGLWLLLPHLHGLSAAELSANELSAEGLSAEGLAPPQLRWIEQQVRLSGLPPILRQEEIERQLGSGLTTSFVVRLHSRDLHSRDLHNRDTGDEQTLEGEALVEVRYELWDEVYLVVVTHVDGRRQNAQLASRAELESWWRELELRLANLPEAPASGARWRLQVELHVLPFSRAEQQDTQRWFRDSLDGPGDGAASRLTEVAQEQRPLNTVLNLLMASSIGRRELQQYRWQLTWTPKRIEARSAASTDTERPP